MGCGMWEKQSEDLFREVQVKSAGDEPGWVQLSFGRKYSGLLLINTLPYEGRMYTI